MPKIRDVLPHNIKRDRVRRDYRKQQGVYRTTFLAVVNGSIRGTRPGCLWVHDLAGADANGNNTYGPQYQLRMKSGAAIQYRPNWKVKVATEGGIELIVGMDEVELERIGYDTLQTNLLDPSRVFKLVEHLENLQSFPNGDATVRVIPSIYRKADGTYDIFGQMDVDILTGNVPSADNQVVVCLWLKIDNTIEVTVSSEESRDTDLKLDPTTALTLINECAAAASVGAQGIWSYIIWDDTTSSSSKNKFHDLRGIVGGGTNAAGAISADTLTLNDGSELTLSANTNGVITVTKARHTVDTFADASTGDLKTVNGLAAGEVCVVTASHTDRTIVVKHTGGTDISCANGLDITLDDTVKGVLLLGNLAGTGVNAYPLFDEVTSSSINTFTNKTISASANTLIQGSGVTKILASDVCAAGTDRNLVISAESSTIDNLIEVSGLVVGETTWLRATAGHTITVVHNSGSATVKIHLNGDTNTTLDEQNPLELKLVATNVLSQEKHSSSGSSILNNYAATTAPTVNDDSGDGYSVGSRWFDVTADKIYECIDATVGAAIWIEVVGRTQAQTLTGKTISASANTVGIGAPASKTIASDAVNAGADRNLVISAQTGTEDWLEEITGLAVGESVYLRAASGHVIHVNPLQAVSIPIHLNDGITRTLDEIIPLHLTLLETDELSENEQAPQQPYFDVSGSQFEVYGSSSEGGANFGLVVDDNGGKAGVGFNGGAITGDYLWKIKGTEGAFGLPSLTTAQRSALTPLENMMVYDTDLRAVMAYVINQWVELPTYSGEGRKFVDPTLQGARTWTVLNHSVTYTFEEDLDNRRLYIKGNGDASLDIRGWYTDAPTGTPYTIIANIVGNWAAGTNTGLAFGFRENATGELALLHLFYATARDQIGNYKYTSPTAFSASYATVIVPLYPPTWFKLEDNGTNRIVSYSMDGVNWVVYHTVGRTDFLTADQIVFGVLMQNVNGFQTVVSLLSYEEL